MSDVVEPDFIESDYSQQPSWTASNLPQNVDNDELHIPSGARISRGTLDETAAQTLKRDLHQINNRLKQVVYPHFPIRSADTEGAPVLESSSDDRCTDLWAPLVFTLAYSVALSRASDRFSGSFVFSWAVIIAMAVHLAVARSEPLSNGPILAYVSTAGYCIFPQVLNAVFSAVLFPLATAPIPSVAWKVRTLALLRLFMFVTCSFWACRSATKAVGVRSLLERFPLLLLLLVLGWSCVIT